MIRIFDEKETDFSHDGIEILDDITISCICERELNGTWFLNAEFLRDDDKCNSIENRKILKVPTSISEQLFRIVNIKSTKNRIYVYAEHIFFDNRHNFIEDTNVVRKDGNNALQQILGGCQYKCNFKGVSTVPIIASARLVRKSLLEALMGDQDNSFLNRWGGEIDFNNFDFIIKSQIGENRGVEVTYGHNMQGFEGEVDESGVVTRIMPMGYNGLLLPEKYVDSPLIDNYAFPKIQVVEISSIKVKENKEDEEGYDTEEEAFQAMRNYVSDLYSIQNIDKPSVNIRVNIITLERTDQFKNEIFERIYIGDTLKVNLEKYGFDVSCRIIGERYDSLNSRYVEVELGDVKSNILKDVTSMKETIDNILTQLGDNNWESFLEQARDEAAQLIQEGIKNSYVVAKKNEILIMDSENVETARNVIRMNKNGIAFSQTGYSGPYVIGITIDGKINANCITTGVLNANLIKAGRIQSLNNKTWISMEDGSFSFADGRITYDETNGFKIHLTSGGNDLESDLNSYKNQINQQITDLSDKINNLDFIIDDTFKDGIVDQIEAANIERQLIELNKYKEQIDTRYTNLYNNVNLTNPEKTDLDTFYKSFVSKYDTLVNTIRNIIEDGLATDEEIQTYESALKQYYSTITNLTTVFDKAITKISENITSQQITALDQLLQGDIKNVSDAIDSLEETMTTTFKDNIIDEAERIAIVESLQRVNSEKLDIDKNYANLSSNINLSGTAKTNLTNKYNAYVSTHETLINYINTAINDGIATEEEKEQIRTLVAEYNLALAEYGVAQTQSINSIADKNADNIFNKYKKLIDKDISDVNNKIENLKDEVSGAIADGIIEEAEALIIKNSIKELDKEKKDLYTRYTELYKNTILSNGTKSDLKTKYNNYSTAHTALITQINKMIEDNVATPSEKQEYESNIANYNIALSKLTSSFDNCINEIALNNINNITSILKTELQGNISDVNDIVKVLQNNFGNYTADGILNEAEKKSIRTHLKTLAAEKSDVDNQYKTVYANTDLTGTAKTNLRTAYNNYVTEYNALITQINTLLEKTTLITSSDMSVLTTKFNNHDTYLAKYSVAISNAIDSIVSKKKEDAISSSNNYTNTQFEVLDEKIELRVEKSVYEKNDEDIKNRLSSAETILTPDGIYNKVTSSQKWIDVNGGVNLIPNPSVIVDLKGWEASATAKISRIDTKKPPSPTPTTVEISCLYGIDSLGIIIKESTGKVIMIDGGYANNNAALLSALAELSITHIDYWIITHFHTDHAEVVPWALDNVNCSNIIYKPIDVSKLNSQEIAWDTDDVYNGVLDRISKYNINVINPEINPMIRLSNDSYIQLFNTSYKEEYPLNYNESSLMVFYVLGKKKFLFAGDCVDSVDSFAASVGKVDFFQVAHHGLSNYDNPNDKIRLGSSEYLIDAIKPTHTLFAGNGLNPSHGYYAKYRHTLARVSLHNSKSYYFDPGCSDANNKHLYITATTSNITIPYGTIANRPMRYWHKKDNGDWYWFKENGKLAKNETLTIDGKSYKFDSTGVCTNP